MPHLETCRTTEPGPDRRTTSTPADGMKLRALACLIFAISACTPSPGRELERAFEAGREALERGNFADAAAAAERGAASSRDPGDLRWAWRFRLLRAEIHLLQLQAREAKPLLSDTPPDGDRFA